MPQFLLLGQQVEQADALFHLGGHLWGGDMYRGYCQLVGEAGDPREPRPLHHPSPSSVGRGLLPSPSSQPLTRSGDIRQCLHQGLEAIILLRSSLEQKGRGLERDLWRARSDHQSILLVWGREGRQLLGLRPQEALGSSPRGIQVAEKPRGSWGPPSPPALLESQISGS